MIRTSGDRLLDRWHEADALLAELLELPASARPGFLDTRCAGDAELRTLLEELLVQEDGATEILPPPFAASWCDGLDQSRAPEFAGLRLGPFEVECLVGSGGLGEVYRARRVEGGFEQRVAIKLLVGAHGADLIRRFHRERDILASLDHPYIATLLDAGIAPGGTPYLVMEYVEGRRINQFCDEEELSVAARLRLFLRVCDAVASAHARLVVHRDLKPSNILVMRDGSPKLLDFGIAGLLEPGGSQDGGERTLTSTRALSPAYASPEQIRGRPVAIASDVFQLGTLLYVLLTGRRPHEDASESPATLIPHILERDPPLPSEAVRADRIGGLPASRVRSALRGDLDTVIMKALRKEPERRYGSVAELSEDIRRHLDGMPIRARPNSWGYRVGSFVRRNSMSVAVVVTLILGLVVGLAALMLQSRRLEAERDRARVEAMRAEAATGFLLDLFDLAGESGGRDTLRVGALLAHGEQLLDERLGDQPLIQIDLLRALAEAYNRVGMDRGVARLLDRRSAAVRAYYGPAHQETVRALYEVGRFRVSANHWAQAVDALEEALAVHHALPPRVAQSDSARALLADVLTSLSTAYRETERTQAALEAVQQAIELRRLLPGGNTAARTRDDAAQLAFVLRGLGRFEDAAALYEQAITLSREQLGEVPPLILNNYAALLLLMDRLEDAEPVFREARELLWPRDGEPSQTLDALHINLALLLTRLGKYDDAVTVTREAEALLRAAFPPDHWRVTRAVGQVGQVYLAAGDCRSGEPLLRDAADTYAVTLGGQHAWTAISRTTHAECLIELERHAEAEQALLEARPILLAARDPPKAAIRRNLEALIRLYERTSRPADAERHQRLLAEMDEGA